jgi:choline dehydrogenase-like flavoprotein
VTDGSAFPTATGVNPMLSILALARRTALLMADR